MGKKAKTYNVIRLALLALAAGVAVGAIFHATQWWSPACYQPTVRRMSNALSQSEFLSRLESYDSLDVHPPTPTRRSF